MDDLVTRMRGPVREHLSRLINRAFNNQGRPLPQFSIPADRERDTDLIVSDAIEEAAARIEALEADRLALRNEVLEEAAKACEQSGDTWLSWAGPEIGDLNRNASNASVHIAASIRALKRLRPTD